MARWTGCSLLLLSLHACGDAAATPDDAVTETADGSGDGDGDGAAARDAGPPGDVGEAIVCAEPDADGGTDDGAALYGEAADVIFRRCGQTRCHGPLPFQGLLDFSTTRCDVRAALVDVPACEYPDMPRVTPGDPERSWLMVKLTAPRDDGYQIVFEPPAGADATPSDDPRCAGHGFGLGMPPPGYVIDESEIETLRRWIEAGAPGPGD